MNLIQLLHFCFKLDDIVASPRYGSTEKLKLNFLEYEAYLRKNLWIAV